jgi:EAL domain-containing protein (putative c-di-GMP-specific phosphodiesterase class I)
MPDTPAILDILLPLGDVSAEIGQRFSKEGALAVIVIDATPLEQIERRYGHEAHTRSLCALGGIVKSVCEEGFGGGEVLASGDVGRSEVILSLACEPGNARFYRDGLPHLVRVIGERIERKGQRVVYPYLRQAPELSIGMAFVLRNPLVSAVTQLRDGLDEARRDAELNGILAARKKHRDLLDIIVSGRLRSVYEPIVSARDFTVFGYEALARGPAGTKLEAPLALFGIAEQENLTFELDCLCRHKAIAGAADFPDDVKLFINIRPTAIHDPSFQPDALTATLDRCGLSPSHVVFEISEQESIENYEIFREARDAYGKLGFMFALDDTGAGYASLEAVLELGPEFIKIDRAFVQGIDEDTGRQNMVRAFQAIAEDTNARIIGEGLSTLEELRTLGSLGIDFGQGWLFGKPSPLLTPEDESD